MTTPSRANPDDISDFLERMNTRRTRYSRGYLKRDRLSFVGHPTAKCLRYKAPPGFGKSVQVAQCAQAALERNEDCIYLDFSSFWPKDLSEADLIANSIVAALSSEGFSEKPTTSSVNILALRLLTDHERPVTICLDGVTDAATTQRFLRAIALETPETVRLVISEGLPDATVSLSVLSDVVTIGPDDLGFTLDETGLVLSLDADQAKRVFDLTGGWPLLCALAGKSTASGEGIVHLPEVQAYFENDVLAQVPQPLRDCLEKASWLEEITEDICNYVFKTDAAGLKLAKLESHYRLLASSAATPNRYEMNRALKDYLRNRFIEANGSRQSYFLKRIAFWHWRRREYRLVIKVALRAQDHNWAQRLGEQALLDLALRQGEIEALITWFTGIPRFKLIQTPSLAIGYAWVLYFGQRAQEAQEVLDRLNALPASDPAKQDDPNGWGELVHAIGLATHDEMKESDEGCTAWVDTYGLVNPVGQAAAQTCRAFIAASDRQFTILSDQIATATVTSGAVRHRYAFGWLAAAGILARLLNGDIYGARAEIRRAQKDENVAHERTPFVRGMFTSFEFQVQAEDETITPDDSLLQEALDFALAFGVTDVVWNTVRSAVEVYIRRGDTSRAFLLLERCRLAANERGLKRLGILIRLGTEVFAMGTRTSTPLGIEPLPSDEDLVFLPNQNRAIQAERELLEASRFLRDGKLGLAERQARKALTNFAAIRDQRGEIRAQCTLATTVHLMGEEKQAKKRMVDANLQAQQLGAFRTLENRRHFLRVISPTAKAFLGQKADQVSIAGKTAHELTITKLPAAHISAPISRKQIGVLQHAALGLSNKEIAARLHVTEDTVKWHFRRILSSLNASNRTEAVLIARSKGLI